MGRNAETVEFFHEFAGWSYDPATQTPEQGRWETARKLAKAEKWAREQGHEVEWHDDDEARDHVAEFDAYDREPETCEVAYLVDSAGEILASLGCIDDADDNYRRVVAAELALEAMSELVTV